jgi:hypothetical protein
MDIGWIVFVSCLNVGKVNDSKVYHAEIHAQAKTITWEPETEENYAVLNIVAAYQMHADAFQINMYLFDQ